MHMIIALTGFMGCGKSSVGRSLAERLGCPFTDLDREVENRCGRSIPEIFASEGEAGFRRMEVETLEQVLERLEKLPLAVLALGGGTQTVPQAAALLEKKTFLVYLEAGMETLRERLEGSVDRPLLSEDPAGLLERRRPVYEKSRMKILTQGKTIETLSARIAENLKKISIFV